MAYNLENEVLYHLTHDPEGSCWLKFKETFKGVNPFDGAQGMLFGLVVKYRDDQKLPNYEVLEADVASANTGPAFAARIAIDDLRGYVGDLNLFPTALQALRDKWIERTTLASTKVAQEIVVSGYKVGRVEMRGIDAAWQYLQEVKQKIADVRDQVDNSGNLFENAERLWERYHTLKSQLGPNMEVPGRMSTGIQQIDALTNGMGGGEFWIVGAYSGEGKSTLLRNMAYNLAVLQGKNVVYATAEMTKQQIEKMMISRHTYHRDGRPKWAPCAVAPVPFRGMRDGSLSVEEEETLRMAKDDMRDGYRSGKYGLLDILQVPGKMTIPDLGDYLVAKNRMHKIDAVFLDYALLFAEHVKTTDIRESYSSRIRACKMLALNFGTRDQLAVVTAHQLNRVSRDEADRLMKPSTRRGADHAPEDIVPYTMRSLAGTSEAEKSADVALWLLLREEYKKNHYVRAGFVKNREGESGKPFNLTTRFQYSFIGNEEGFNRPE